MAFDTDDREMKMRLRALSSGLSGRGISVLHQNIDNYYDLAENLPAAWPAQEIIGKSDADILSADLATLFLTGRDTALKLKLEQSAEFELLKDMRRQRFEARFVPDDDGMTIIITDVTEERSREAAVNALLREVSHRSKNLLAIVQSVAMQTARHSDSIKDFLDKFRGRLHALSSTQDLVTESNWQGTYLQSLVASQLARVFPSALKDLRVTGDNPLLGPNASLHIGLAVHELAANAAIYGALSANEAGNIWVDAHIEVPADEPPILVFEWQEVGIDTTQAGNAPRFGTMVLERIVPLSVGGTASLTIEDDRLSYRLVVPADQFEV